MTAAAYAVAWQAGSKSAMSANFALLARVVEGLIRTRGKRPDELLEPRHSDGLVEPERVITLRSKYRHAT